MAWIGHNAAALAILVSIIAALIPAIQFTQTKRSEDRKSDFRTYHRLIEDLVSPPAPKLDRQIAIVFELRNFKKYFAVSIRILEALKADWKTNPDIERLFREIDLSIAYMKDCSEGGRWLISRLRRFVRRREKVRE